MEITETRDGDVLLVGLIGHLDGFTIAEAEPRLAQLRASGEQRVVLDLTQLDYISSVGLGALVTLRRQLEEAGGRVFFCSAQPAILDMLKMTGVLQLFPYKSSPVEAVAACRAQ